MEVLIMATTKKSSSSTKEKQTLSQQVDNAVKTLIEKKGLYCIGANDLLELDGDAVLKAAVASKLCSKATYLAPVLGAMVKTLVLANKSQYDCDPARIPPHKNPVSDELAYRRDYLAKMDTLLSSGLINIAAKGFHYVKGFTPDNAPEV
jgi:hypothetical protein